MSEDQGARWRAHLVVCREWQAMRRAACLVGADEAEAAYRDGRPRLRVFPGEVHAVRRAGSVRAGGVFERRTGRPAYDGNRKAVALMFVPEEEEGAALTVGGGGRRG